MSDNLPAPTTSSKTAILLPYVALVLTVAAFGLGAPARLAHLNLRTTALASLEYDSSIRYEPALSTEWSDVRLVGVRRVSDALLNRHLIALR